MKKLVSVSFAVILAFSAAISAGEEFSEVEYYKKLAEKQLADMQQQQQPATPSPVEQPVYHYYSCEEEAAPANAFVAIPQFFHSRAKKDTADFRGGKLFLPKSRANGMGVTTAYNRRVNDWFSFSVMYEYAYMGIRGGAAYPADAKAYAKERTRYHSHVVGFQPEFNFGALGRLTPSIIQGFDRASGGLRVYDEQGLLEERLSQDDEGTNVTSLMAWYEKDFAVGDNWKLTPYAGWRSLHVKMKSANPVNDGHWMWVHLVSGGMKVAYQRDGFGVNLRAGVSHRTTRDDVPGYGNRAVANGVVHFSHRANMDRTVGSVGAGVNYAINRRALVGVNYDGFFGGKTSAHMGSLSFVFPF